MKKDSIHLLCIVAWVLMCSCEEEIVFPPGWESAVEVEYYVSPASSGCTGMDDTMVEVGAEIRDSKLSIRVKNLGLYHHDGQQTVGVRKQGNNYDLLIWGPDLLSCEPEPRTVRAVLGGVSDGTRIRVYKAFGESPEPYLNGEGTIEEGGDCIALTSCSDDSECLGADVEGEYSYACFEIDECGGHFCAWDNEFEWMEEFL